VRQALELALEALQVATTPLAKDRQEVLRAITAIKEALAQPEQEPVAEYVGFTDYARTEDDAHGFGKVKRLKFIPLNARLYTTPPQRTWVGLTHSDIDQGLLRSDYAFKTAEAWRAGVVFAMTKLKEKNT